MKIVTIGGGPAGLYVALLMKKANPAHDVTVLERNGPDEAFGWGVVFSAQTLENFRAADAESYDAITGNFAHWDDIDVHFKGRTITSGGHGFAGLGRRTLLRVLQQRATALGVDLRFHQEVKGVGALVALGLGDADLIVASDGVRSAIRDQGAALFRPDLDVRPARYVWLGTAQRFSAFTFIIVNTEFGVFQAHAYRYDDDRSTFIVECDDRSWRNAGFAAMDIEQTVAACERMFAPWLGDHPLLANTPPQSSAAPWLRFTRVTNQSWHDGKTVLIGDAAHTAHFSIGSGTKLAMEDAIALAAALNAPDGTHETLGAALQAYEDARRVDALRLQNAARNSMEWFENVRRYVALEPEQFAYSLLTRSQRVSHENLRLRDGAYVAGVERWFASRASAQAAGPPVTDGAPVTAGPPSPPPMFTPFTLRGLRLVNRVVVSPMDMYSATDGVPNDFHLVHLGARALGGAGLVMTEMACVSAEGRITNGCTGMYTDTQRDAWRRITQMVHQWSGAKICLQLGHSGRKGSTKLMWEGNDEPLDSGNWPVIAPSALAFREGMQVPREMTRADMDRVRDEFARAARRAADADFDMLELHCAHGYLLSSFLTPLSNRRVDPYGGVLENRLRYPLEVFAAVRSAFPGDRPISVRISATDWIAGGVDGDEAVTIARAFRAAGADIIHVSAGQTSSEAKPIYGRMFQTPLSDRVRNEGGGPTIAVGNITEADQVNSIIASGRADLCALARPHLADPNWTLHAAAQLGYTPQPWPPQYLAGKDQLQRLLRRRALELAETDTP